MIVLHPIKETDVRKISFLMPVLLVAACVSCVSCMPDIKPLLKPRVIPLAQRIADQQRWIDKDITAKAMTVAQAKPIRAKLAQIKKKYDVLRAAGPLTPADSEAINKMLDKTSDQIFRISTKVKGLQGQ